MWKTLTTAIKILPPVVQLIIFAGAALGIYLLISHIIKAHADKIKQGIIENSTSTTTVTGAGGASVPVQVNLGTVATAIHSKFHGNDWFGWSEDEVGAMTELTNVPKSLIPNLSAVYYQLYSANLKEDFQSYLSSDQWNQISNLFN